MATAIVGGEEGNQPKETPNDIFKRMALNDEMQNKTLANKLTKKAPGYTTKNGNPPGGPKKVTYTRFYVCILGVLSLAMSQMNRMVINICIPSMVDPSMLKPKDHVIGGEDSCPWPEELNIPTTTCLPSEEPPTTTTLPPPPTTTTHLPPPPTTTMIQPPPTTTTSQPPPTTTAPLEPTPSTIDPMLYLITSQNPLESTTSSYLVRYAPNDTKVLDDDDDEISHLPVPEVLVDKFKWDMDQQSYLLGGFFWSYFLFMILGGWIAETYGAKYVLLLGVAGSSIISLSTPWMARNSLTLLVCSRILMGALQSGVFPAMYAVISKWLTMSEASIFAPMIKMNLRLGMLMASAVPGMVSAWPNVFYLTGIAGAIWSALWFVLATSNPEDNKWVSEGELEHIVKKKRKKVQVETVEEGGLEMGERINGTVTTPPPKKPEVATAPPTPWAKILTNSSVIGLIIVKYTFNTGADFLSIELPSYLAYVHHVERQKISAVTSFMFSIQVSLVVFVGWLAKEVIKRRPLGMSKTVIRKLFQSLANFGVGTCLLLITFNDCNLTYVIVLLQFTSFLSMFGAGGETMLPYDLSDQYPATIMAIANSVANLSGLTVTSVAGKILGGHGGSYSRWNLLIYLISGANIFGGLMFVSLVKAKPIDFEAESKKKKQRRSDLEEGPSYVEAEVKLEPPVPAPAVAFATIAEQPAEDCEPPKSGDEKV